MFFFSTYDISRTKLFIVFMIIWPKVQEGASSQAVRLVAIKRSLMLEWKNKMFQLKIGLLIYFNGQFLPFHYQIFLKTHPMGLHESMTHINKYGNNIFSSFINT